jgi:hypothetical protein
MALLNSKFDITRGYPNGSALAEPFAIIKIGSPLAPKAIPQGKIVTQSLQSGVTVMDVATSPNLSVADPIQVWLVVESNDDFSGTFVGKLNAILLGTGVIWETTDFAAGSYPPGTAVSFSAGQVKVKGANEQIIGYVVADESATSKGTIRIAG